MGGLGNQMFQIAAATSLALDNNDKCAFSLQNHHLPLQGNKVVNYRNNIFRNVDLRNEELFHSQTFIEPSHSYSPIPYISGMMLVGYFQSEKYFASNKDYIREMLQASQETKEYLRRKYHSIFTSGKTIVSLHVRRGDYLKLQDYHYVCPLSYYQKSMEWFEDAVYVVFSDDIMWCKVNLPLDSNCVFIEDNPDQEDLYLMSLCDHHIIGNSSFSWWGAWLNASTDKKVIAPQTWFGPRNADKDTKDLYCDGWVRL